ncbi:hypothetical protein PM082_014537 [Marasmius tenuissimus]|nr:hypothetical protein PM082_014537 [Marasmius tenuissimus]
MHDDERRRRLSPSGLRLRALNIGYWDENELVLHSPLSQVRSSRTTFNPPAAPNSSSARSHIPPPFYPFFL